MSEFVHFEVQDGVGTIRLDRPPMNALSAQVQQEIRGAAYEATTRADVRAVVVHGGPKVFAAGADVKEMVAWSYQEMVDRSAALQASFTAVAGSRSRPSLRSRATPSAVAASSRCAATCASPATTPSSVSRRSCSGSSRVRAGRSG